MLPEGFPFHQFIIIFYPNEYFFKKKLNYLMMQRVVRVENGTVSTTLLECIKNIIVTVINNSPS